MKKCLLKLDFCNTMTYMFKVHVKMVKIYMVKFNVAILSRLKIMGFFLNTKKIDIHNVIFSKTVTKLVTILAEVFFSKSEPCKLP